MKITVGKSKKSIKSARYSDSVPYNQRRYWYFTTHGIGPGTLPKGVKVLDVQDGQNDKGTWGAYILLDSVLNTDELREYDLRELAPQNPKKYGIFIGNSDVPEQVFDYKEDAYDALDEMRQEDWYGKDFKFGRVREVNSSRKPAIACGKKSVKASTYNSIELTFISPDLETGRLVADKAWEIGGFGSTWNEHSWVHIDVPSSQSVDNVDDLIEYAQSVGVYLNRRSAELIGTWADSKTQTVLRGCTEKSIKYNKRRGITAAEGLNDMKIIVKSKAYVDITVDDYEQGALNMVNSWDFDVRGEYDTLQELIDRIADESYIFSNNIADYYYMDGRIGTSAMVDADNSVPTDGQYEAWKRGEENLYIADLYLSLEVGGGSHEMTEEEAEAFGLALY